MRKYLNSIFLWTLLLLPFFGLAQPDSLSNGPAGQEKRNRLEIISTELFEFSEFEGKKIRKLLRNVHLRQDTTDMFCDSAYHYVDSNYVIAFSDVRIVLDRSRGREVKAQKLTYDGETKIVELYNDVVLTDSSVRLTTNRLTYYRVEDYGRYFTGGKIENGENTLYSRTGYYYPQQEMTYFRNDVLLVNPDFLLETDTLGYHTEKEVAYFLAPTYVYDSLNSMYTEDGYYNTRADVAYFYRNSQVGDTSYTLFADTIAYDEDAGRGQAYGNVMIMQSDSGLTLYGETGEFFSETEYSYLTDQAFGIQYFDEDTLFLFADTLASVKDTVNDQKVFYAYYGSSFFMNDLQGISDSITYLYDDSLLLLDLDPVLWSDSTQIMGETIHIKMSDGNVDSMAIPKKAFLISQEDTVGFNQIKGQAMNAKFKDNRMDKMWIYGNSQSIYFTKDDEDGEYIGMNEAKCIDMYIEFEDNKPSSILFKESPEGTFSPMYDVIDKPNRLDGFRWRESERPIRPDYIFPVINPEEDTILAGLDSALAVLRSYQHLMDSVFSFGSEGENKIEDKVTAYLDSLKSIPDSLLEADEDDLDLDSLALDSLGMDSIMVDSLALDSLAMDSTANDSLGKGGGRDRGTGKGKGKGKPKKDKPKKDKKPKKPKKEREPFTLRGFFKKISDAFGLQGRRTNARREQARVKREYKRKKKEEEKARKAREKAIKRGEIPEQPAGSKGDRPSRNVPSSTDQDPNESGSGKSKQNRER